jgi:protocatechuate 3,4-dioxygenase beta subunit
MKYRVCPHLLIGCCMLLGLVLLVSPVLWSQEAKGTITGTVTDPQGALVPGAKVEVKNLGTNMVTSTVTSGAGVYSLMTLKPGQYDVMSE